MNEGHYVQVNCLVSEGDLPLNIKWLFNGNDINQIHEISTGKLGKRSSFLTIESVSYANAGNYTCQATNFAGQIEYTANLQINGSFC